MSIADRPRSEIVERLRLTEAQLGITTQRADSLQQQLEAANQRIELLQILCDAAYQMAGVHEAPVGFLDNLSDGANGDPLRHDSFSLLPVGNQWRDQLEAAIQMEKLAVESAKKYEQQLEAANRAREEAETRLNLSRRRLAGMDEYANFVEKRAEAAEAKLASATAYIASLDAIKASPWNPDQAVTALLDIKTAAKEALAQIGAPDSQSNLCLEPGVRYTNIEPQTAPTFDFPARADALFKGMMENLRLKAEQAAQPSDTERLDILERYQIEVLLGHEGWSVGKNQEVGWTDRHKNPRDAVDQYAAMRAGKER